MRFCAVIFISWCIMTRKDAREQAFILIFEKEISKLDTAEVLENAAEARDIITDEFSEDVFNGTYNNISDIDKMISDNLEGWSIERLSKVVLALLRLSTYEIMFCNDVPVSVSINEAVELCKKYATVDDSAYLNGVLGSVAKKIGR